jgi:uncharacterized damage-inducible protein DinB
MTEAWLTGPVDGVDPFLMPAAHAFVQVKREVPAIVSGLSTDELWARPGASASIGFHAMHIAGATDRLLTYARGVALSDTQLAAMRAEASLSRLDGAALIAEVERALDAALAQIRATPPDTLTDRREVGRKRLPSTVLGLIFHAAEHATRHAGQMATLRRIVHRLAGDAHSV